MTTDDFLRDKTRVTYERETTIIDKATGELLQQENETHRRISTEPDYIKLYYKTMMAVNEIGDIPLSFLLGLSAQIGFTNGDKVLYFNNATTRRSIATYMDIGDNMVNKYIRRCVEKGVLFKTADRGTYEVNPWMIAKGKWEHIRQLQANFEFVAGKWERVAVLESTDQDDEQAAG